MLGRGVKGQPARQMLSLGLLFRVRGYWGGYHVLPGISGRWCHSLPLMVPDGGKTSSVCCRPGLTSSCPSKASSEQIYTITA